MTQLVFIDYETHFDSEYSLKKMSVAEYIRDQRFTALGVAYALGADSPPQWTEDAAGGTAALPHHAAWVAHNAQFDGALAWHHYRARPALWLDTQLMARYLIAQGHLPPDLGVSLAALAEFYGLEAKGDTTAAVAAGGAELAEYARHDILLTQRLLREFLPRIPQQELRLMDLHVRMATEPVLGLNKPLLQREVDSYTVDPQLAPHLRSNAKFAALLEKLGVPPGTKTSPTTGKQTWAFAKTDEFMQGLFRHEDPRVRYLAGEREKAKSSIRHTRAQKFLDVGEPMPVPLLYYGAHTGRSSGGGGLNMQNLPRGGNLRKALVAPPGHALVIVDSSQIEVRVLAWRAQDQVLMGLFDRGLDVYRWFAEALLGTPYDDVTHEERQLAKPPMLACGFGQRARGLVAYAQGMGIEMNPRVAERAVELYSRRFRGVVAHWTACMQEIKETGRQQLPGGRAIEYPDMRWDGRDIVYDRPLIFSRGRVGQRQTVRLWHGLAVENDTQGVAAEVVMHQALLLAEKYKIVNLVHDEAVLCVPEDLAEQAKADALEAFATTPPWAPGLITAGEAKIRGHYV